MPTCKEVAKAIAQDELGTGPWRRGLALQLHLLMCRHCRRYAAQIRAIGGTVRSLVREQGEDPKALEQLERTILRDSLEVEPDSDEIKQ